MVNKLSYTSLVSYAFKPCIGTLLSLPIGIGEWLGRQCGKEVGMKVIVEVLKANFIFILLSHSLHV
jgi:hypothetical protein